MKSSATYFNGVSWSAEPWFLESTNISLEYYLCLFKQQMHETKCSQNLLLKKKKRK